jgi:hypothetical protein
MNTLLYLNNLYKDNNVLSVKVNKNLETKIIKKEYESFKNYVLNNIDRIVFNYRLSGYKKMEKEISLKKKDLKLDERELKKLYLAKKNLDIYYGYQKDSCIMRTDIYAKSKIRSDFVEEEDPTLNRYIFNHSKYIKILDKLWLMEISDNLGDLNKILINDIFYINENIKPLAVKITNKRKNIILLDLKKAFDSVRFDTIKTLLGRFLERNVKYHYKYLKQYLYLLKNRNCYYKNNQRIKINKGIPTGLASSNLVFTIILNEIFLELFKIFNYLDYFDFYIYVDDICIEIKNEENKHLVLLLINDLDKLLKKYGLILNEKKCKMSYNFKGILDFGYIENEDLYLGIPFERRENRYKRIILNDYNNKNDCNYTFNEFYNSNDNKIKGFLNYKMIDFKNSKIINV